MKAMIRRDLYLNWRILLGTLLALAVVGALNKDLPVLAVIYMGGFFLSIMSLNLSFYTDETSHDIQYYLLVNQGQKKYLRNKCLVSLFLDLVTALVSLAYLAFSQGLLNPTSLLLAGLAFSFLLVINGILLVFFIYFGSQKGRYLVMVLWFGLLYLSKYIRPGFKDLVQSGFENIPLSLALILGGSFLIMGLSYFLSMKRLNQKDF